eukprot:scaffold10035_cov48-Phaeocystis_antarctica.AAC.1
MTTKCSMIGRRSRNTRLPAGRPRASSRMNHGAWDVVIARTVSRTPASASGGRRFLHNQRPAKPKAINATTRLRLISLTWRCRANRVPRHVHQ